MPAPLAPTLPATYEVSVFFATWCHLDNWSWFLGAAMPECPFRLSGHSRQEASLRVCSGQLSGCGTPEEVLVGRTDVMVTYGHRMNQPPALLSVH